MPPARFASSGVIANRHAQIKTHPEKEARLAALNRAHEIRRFEIDMYWKRATYFWVLQAAVFTALGLILSESDGAIPPFVVVALAALGLLTSLAGWFSAEGSKFWQENWERHIDMLEDEFEGKLHKTVWVGKMGMRWSVSNINNRLILFFSAFWLLTFITVTLNAMPSLSWRFASSVDEVDFGLLGLIAIVVATAAGVLWLYGQKTKLRGTKQSLDDNDVPPEVQTGQARLLPREDTTPFLVKRGQKE